MKARPPRSGGRAFTRTVGKRAVAFTLDAPANRLFWKTDSGKWAGLTLLGEQTAALQSWIGH